MKKMDSSWLTKYLKVGHSGFNLSKTSRGTCKMGYMIPIYCTDVLPTDKFRISVSEMVRFLPMIAPPMHDVNVFFDYFFVLIGLFGQIGKISVQVVKMGIIQALLLILFRPKTVFRFLAWLTILKCLLVLLVNICLLCLFRAHNLIYNYYVRNEDMGAERTVPLTDGLDTTSPLTLFKRCWPRDYFTGALNDRQRGDPSYLPLGTQAPLTISADGALKFKAGEQVYDVSMNGSDGAGVYNQVYVSPGTGSAPPSSVPATYHSGLAGSADLTLATAASVDDVRTAFQTQLIKQLLKRAGYRYREFMMAFFNTDAGDGRLQWPSYIGGMSSPALFSEVLQTSSSDSVTPQGNMAGHGISATRTQRLSYRVPEDGWIIGYMSICPKACYTQGLPRKYTRETRYDYYNPLFAHLGEKLILNEEIYCDGTSADKQGFAFAPQYEEYRRAFDTSHGLLKSTAAYWAFDRVFSERPVFNQDFLECTPSRAPFVDQTDVDQIVYAVRTHAFASRPVAKKGTPGFVDHYF